MRSESVKIYFDGGSRGNPGPASGAAFADYDGGRERSCFISSATNNEAEYRGLLMGVELAKELALPDVIFLGDSKLVVMQVRGEWKAKHPMMNQLKIEVLAALRALPRWDIEWIPREQNSDADRIANQTMDSHQGLTPIVVPSELISAAPSRPDKAPHLKSEPPSRDSAIRADIQQLNALGAKASFTDFRALKVGGMDSYSRATIAALTELIPNFSLINEAFVSRLRADPKTKSLSDTEMDKLHINALRWCARGLGGELALRKVLTDLEITQNIRGKKP